MQVPMEEVWFAFPNQVNSLFNTLKRRIYPTGPSDIMFPRKTFTKSHFVTIKKSMHRQEIL